MITVVAEPENVPPRNVITVSVSDPANPDEVIESITINRVVSGVRTPLRQQPVPGSSEIVAFDYEAPYGVAAAYEWSGTYLNLSDVTEVFSEDWSDLTAWTLEGNVTPTVSGGKLHIDAEGSDKWANLVHPIASGKYRVVVENPITLTPQSFGDYQQLSFIMSESQVLQLQPYFPAMSPSSPLLQWTDGSTFLNWHDDGTADSWTFDITEESVVFTPEGQSPFAINSDRSITELRIQYQQASGTLDDFLLGAITVYSYGATDSAGDLSDPVTLSPDNGWLIHPSLVNRSVELGNAADSIAIAAIGELKNVAKATTHNVIGRPDPIVVAEGPRASDQFDFSLITDSADQRDAIRTLVQDQTPILINVDPAFGYDVAYGFYSVGDVSTARLVQLAGEFHRTILLPLTSVRAPTVSLSETGWSFASVASEFPTFDSVAAGFATFNDLLLNVRV